MSPILSLVTVVVLAFILGRALAPYTERAFGSSHVEYVFVGVLIGPAMPPIIFDAELLTAFRPFVSLLLGLLAFLVGLRLRGALRDFETFSAGVFASLGVVVAVGAATIGMVQYFEPALLETQDPILDLPFYFDGQNLWSLWISPQSLWLGLVMGAAAAISSSSALSWARAKGYGGPKTIAWVDALASASHVTAIVVFGVALAGTQANATASALGLTVTEWAVISAGAGVACGILFGVFIGDEAVDTRVQLATVGAVTFASGVGEALGVSPLFVNLAAGAVIGLTSGHAERVRAAIESLRDPIVILLMLFAGTLWVWPQPWVWALVVVYFVARLLARRLFTRIAVDAFSPADMPRARVGNALLSQGVLGAAIVIGFAQQSPEFAPLATTTVLVAMLAAQLVAPGALRRYLVDAGGDSDHEQRPAPEPQAPSESTVHESAAEPETEPEAAPVAPSEDAAAAKPSVRSEPRTNTPAAAEVAPDADTSTKTNSKAGPEGEPKDEPKSQAKPEVRPTPPPTKDEGVPRFVAPKAVSGVIEVDDQAPEESGEQA